MTAKITITGDMLPSFWDRMAGEMHGALEARALEAAQYVNGEIRSTAQSRLNKNPTGRLMRSFKEEFLGRSGGTLSAGSFSDLVYAGIHNTGGVIRAKGDGWLKFKIGKDWVQVKQVTIPATHYIDDTEVAVKPEVENILRNASDDAVDGAR